MEQKQFIQVSLEELKEAILKGVEAQIESLKKHFEAQTLNEYLTSTQVARMLDINTATLARWRRKGLIKSYEFNGAFYYTRQNIEEALKPKQINKNAKKNIH